jgi:hypothetical protein
MIKPGTGESLRAAVSASAGNNRSIVLAAGIYTIDKTIEMPSNTSLRFLEGALLKAHANLNGPVLSAKGAANIHLNGVVIEATNQTASTDAIVFDSCRHLELLRCAITGASLSALSTKRCSHVVVRDCKFAANFHYGHQDYAGEDLTVTNCTYHQNGARSGKASGFGRGLVLWRTSACRVESCHFSENSEYGFRVYSEHGEESSTRNVVVADCHFIDNGKIDIYVYNDSGRIDSINFDQCVVSRQTEPTLGAVSLSGSKVVLRRSNIRGQRGFAHSFGVQLYQASDCLIESSVIQEFAIGIEFAGHKQPPQRCIIRDTAIRDVDIAIAAVMGAGHLFEGVSASSRHPVDHQSIEFDAAATLPAQLVNYRSSGFNDKALPHRGLIVPKQPAS